MASKAHYAQRKQAGVCPNCGGARQHPLLMLCGDCLAAQRARQAHARQQETAQERYDKAVEAAQAYDEKRWDTLQQQRGSFEIGCCGSFHAIEALPFTAPCCGRVFGLQPAPARRIYGV